MKNYIKNCKYYTKNPKVFPINADIYHVVKIYKKDSF